MEIVGVALLACGAVVAVVLFATLPLPALLAFGYGLAVLLGALVSSLPLFALARIIRLLEVQATRESSRSRA